MYIAITLIVSFFFNSSNQNKVDEIWQTYYDSTDLYWDSDLVKTEQLLLDAKQYLQNSSDSFRQDSIYNITLLDLAVCYHIQNRYSEALTLNLEALENVKKSMGKFHPMYGDCLNDLGLLYQNMGNYNKALPLYLDAIENTKFTLGKEHIEYGYTISNLGYLYTLIGRFEEALPLFEEALENSAKNVGKDDSDYGLSLSNLGALYIKMKQFDIALPILLEAVENAKKSLGTKHPEYGLKLNNLAECYNGLGDYDSALPIYIESLENCLNSYGKNHFEYGIRLNNLAYLYKLKGEYEKALPLFLEALENTKSSLGENHKYYRIRLNNLASLYQLMNKSEKAIPLILEANNSLSKEIHQVFSISNEKNKIDFLNLIGQHFQQYQSFAFDHDYNIDTLNQMLFDNELLHKSLVLNSTKHTIESIRKSNNRNLITQLNTLKDLRNHLAEEYGKPISQRSYDLDSLERIANALEELLVLKSSEFADFKMQVSWKDVKSSLKHNEAAIEFVSFKHEDIDTSKEVLYAAMMVNRSLNSPKIISLFSEQEISKLLKNDSKKKELQFINQLYGEDELYNLVWSKLEEELTSIETVYFAPSGLLHQISFNAILTPEKRLLSQQYNLIQVNSCRQLVKATKMPKLSSILLYGGIQYNYDTTGRQPIINNEPLFTKNKISSFTDQRGLLVNDLSYLPGSLLEVQNITKRLNKTIKYNLMIHNEATEKSFKSLSGNSPRIIHVSTHGFFFSQVISNNKDDVELRSSISFRNDENPLFRSGLIFAGSNYAWQRGFNPYEEEDGILTAYEISNLDLSNTNLVVLSACKTGLGEIKGSEGVYGLQRAFKMAGVNNLIMSLWKVPDKETVELMELFYDYLMQGYDIRKAFNKAQVRMSELYTPAYWAAFILVGDVIEPKAPASKIHWLLLGIFISLCSFGLYFRLKSNKLV